MAIGSALLAGGCAEVQMRYNVLTYDTAIADTSNQLLLLNAVRASQRYPMSFTSVGQVIAGPQVVGGLSSNINFASLTGLSTYNLTPNLSATPGYSQFALDNLNSREFMEAIRKRIPPAVTRTFYSSTNWPRELLNLLYVQQIHMSPTLVRSIDDERKRICLRAGSERRNKLCNALDSSIAEFTRRCTDHFVDGGVRFRELSNDSGIYYNTAVNYCRYERFHILLNEMRLVGRDPCQSGKPSLRCVPVTYRSALQMIAYLGELIAAQNFGDTPFTPMMFYGHSTEPIGFEFVPVPIFVVRRGVGIKAAVSVSHEGESYYIPQPDFGSREEARSLQTLYLVLQTVRAATHRRDLPKIPSFGIVTR